MEWSLSSLVRLLALIANGPKINTIKLQVVLFCACETSPRKVILVGHVSNIKVSLWTVACTYTISLS